MPFYERKDLRLPGMNYAAVNCYFVTLVCHEHRRRFGQVIDGCMHLNALGEIADACLSTRDNLMTGVDTSVRMVMPDHVHILISLFSEELPPLGTIVGRYKTWIEREARRLASEQGRPYERLWQRNYYDHVIRDLTDYNIKVDYILSNPQRWFLKHGNGG